MIVLKNSFICLEIQEPGVYYKGSRFDWTGQIVQITYLNKYTFCTAESFNKSLLNKLGKGLYNEFGIDSPVGFNECPIGGKFPKIGVGLLTKTTKNYDFHTQYQIFPYLFTYRADKNEVKFFCKADKLEEYPFQLSKEIILNKNSFSINYTLENLGSKEIKTNEYVHNFLAINNKKIDSSYKLLFPFELKQEDFGFIVNPDNVVCLNKDFVSWNFIPKSEFFISNLNGKYHGKGAWRLIDLENKIGIQETTNFNIQKINLWGTAHVVSPEIFIELSILPKKTLTWSRTYTVFSVS